jgi:hypothetical protein
MIDDCCIAVYVHPIEHLVANITPLFAELLIIQSHVMVFWLWLYIGNRTYYYNLQ